MTLLRARIATATAVAILMSTVNGAVAQADARLAIRLMEAPAERADDPRAQSYIIDHVGPGVAFERRIELSSTASEPVEVELYAADASIEDGHFLPAAGRQQRGSASWISVEPSRVRVPAHGASTATVRIAVPADAPAGEHYAVVWAQPPSAVAGGASVVNRVGIRVYLSVGSGGEPVTDFAVTGLRAIRAGDGRPVVEALVSNTGGRAVDVMGQLDLTEGPAGLSAGPFSAEPGTTVAPGGSARMVFLLDAELPDGPWTATLVARSGLTEREVVGELTFPEAAGSAADPVDVTPVEEQRRVLIPLAGSLIGLTMVGLILLWLVQRRGRKRAAATASHEPPRVPVG